MDKKFDRHLEGIEANLELLDWLNTLQFASDAFIFDGSLTDATKLSRAHSIARLTTYLAVEARDSIEGYIADLEEWKKANDKPTAKASNQKGAQ